MARPVTLFTGQWADLPLDELAAKAGVVGLRRPRARVLGRPLRGRQGARRRRLLPRPAGAPRAQRPRGLGDRRAPRRPGRLRPDRRAPPRDPAARGLRRRRSGGRPPARRGADEGHRARCREARRHAGERLHGLLDLAPDLLVPAERLRRDRARLRGLRGAVGADHGRLRRGGREVRPRGAPDGDRLRLRHDAEDARRDREPRGVRHQPRPEPLRPPVPRHGAVRARVRRPDLPRARQGLEEAARRPPVDPRLAPQLRRGGARLGLRLARATATSTSRTSSAR